MGTYFKENNMAKRWSEVESSSAYRKMSPMDQFGAKKEYWNNVISRKEEIQLMSAAEEDAVKEEFFGGVLLEDLPDSSFKQKNAALQTIGGVANTIGRSSTKLVGGVIQPVIHPVQTVKGLTGLLAGTFQKLVPGEQPQEKYFDAVAKHYKNRYGSEDAIADTISEDPFGYIADVYAIVGAAGGIAKLGKVGLTKAGVIPSTAKAAADVAKTSNVIGKIGKIDITHEAGMFPMTGRGLGAAVKSPFKLTAKTFRGAKELIRKRKADQDIIFTAYNKAFAPKGKTGKRVIGMKDDVVTRVKAIQETLPEEGFVDGMTGEKYYTPSNRYQTLQAFENSKTEVWNKATALSQGATDSGAKINLVAAGKKAANKTIKEYGKVASKTTKKKIIKQIIGEVEDMKNVGEMTPTQAQAFLKTMTKDVQKLRQSGDVAHFDLNDFRANLYSEVVMRTDKSVMDALGKAGYNYWRKQYGVLKGGEKEILSAANAQMRGAGGGVTHPIANLFSLEAIGSGIAGGQTAAGFGKASIIQGAVKIIDWMKSPDRRIKGMFEAANRLKSDEITSVVPRELLSPTYTKEIFTGIPVRRF